MDAVVKYIDGLLEKSTPDAPVWNIEKIKQGLKSKWNYIDGCMIKAAPCDPTGENGESSALCVVHGGVKNRVLTTGDGKALTDVRIAQLSEHGIYAV